MFGRLRPGERAADNPSLSVTLQPGARLGPYAIASLVGRGGMGEVYRALDTRIDRVVAVKILPPDTSNAERRQRFEREARAVARLNHPNICALYDVGHQDGTEFLVMEYLEGQTLAARLAHEPLPLDEALRYAAALADAVASAHQQGIVHRDIKPSNIFLTASGPKLLDFGLAKLRDTDGTPAAGRVAERPTVEGVSRDGALIGTFVYMAPEQLEGRAVDGRTDIFALGLVIYEMVTGRRAFDKSSQAGVIAAILKEEPPLMSDVRPMTPKTVDRVVRACLAKAPDDRWQDARDLSRELTWLATGSGAPPPLPPTETVVASREPGRSRVWVQITGVAGVLTLVAAVGWMLWSARKGPVAGTRSLVVLPCRAIGDDLLAQAYCDGLADTLSAQLMSVTGAHGLQMTSTLEARQHQVTSAAEAGRQFGATFTLEGSMLRSGETVRVNYALVETSTLHQIDAFSVTTSAGDPFALQDSIGRWAATALALKLNEPEARALTARGTEVPGAFEFYLQGRGYLLDYQRSANVDTAIELFNRALTLDTKYALAHAGLGQAFWHKYDDTRDSSWVDRARGSCGRAIELGSALAEAHICAGTVSLGTGRYDEAAQEFQKAIDRNPASDEAVLGLARAQERQGDAAAAERTYLRAVQLRPQYWATHTWLGTFYRDRARYPEAAAQYEQAVSLTPDNPAAYFILGSLNVYLGRYENAIASFKRSIDLGPTAAAYSNWGMTYYRMRRFNEAVGRLESARAIAPNNFRVLGNLARAQYWQGDKAKATGTCDKVIALAGDELGVNAKNVDAHLLVAECYARRGDRTHVVEHISAATAAADTDPHAGFFVAMLFNELGDRAQAFEWLRRSAGLGLPRAELDSWIDIDNLRQDPAFAGVLNAFKERR